MSIYRLHLHYHAHIYFNNFYANKNKKEDEDRKEVITTHMNIIKENEILQTLAMKIVEYDGTKRDPDHP